MHFDFEFFLVAITLVSGVVWALDAMLWAPGRRRNQMDAKEPVIIEYARSFFPIFMVVLVLRSFIVEPFRIPSGSMMPTLLVGDFILVNKFAYGIRLPVLHNKVIEIGDPERGDVAVFRYPDDPSVDYIKRIVALPGDVVAYRGRTLYVNGEKYTQQPLGQYNGVGQGKRMSGVAHLKESTPEGSREILIDPMATGRSTYEFEYKVPEGHYFAMGDNRDNSADSRFWGPLPEANMVGKAFFIWMSYDAQRGDGITGHFGWERIGSGID